MYYIYKYTNKENGKVYIGQTRHSLAERAQSNGRNYRECRRFYNAIQKYSWDAFVPEVIETAETSDEANERERYYISLYNTTDDRFGYNILPGGDTHTLSEDSRLLISVKAKRRYSKKENNPMYGKKHTKETIQKQRERKLGSSNPMFGSHWTDTQREKSGTRGKHLNLSDERREALRENFRKLGKETGFRRVKCLEDQTEYCSVSEAANAYGVAKSTMCGHLRGHQKTCCNKHFEYVN